MGTVICFVGSPGVSKTTLGRSIARALGRPFELYLDLEFDLSQVIFIGTEQSWIGWSRCVDCPGTRCLMLKSVMEWLKNQM